MTNIIPLALQFKGQRDYIQGPDMLDSGINALLTAQSGTIEKLEFSIHKMTGKNLSLHFVQSDSTPKLTAQVVAILKFHSQSLPWYAAWIEQDSIPTGRIPYDESHVVKACSLDLANKKLMLTNPSPFNFIETAVSMTKLLHQRLFPEVTAQWIFCRWVSFSWPVMRDLAGLEVHLKQKLGTKLTCCDVTLDDKHLGQIYFSTREKS